MDSNRNFMPGALLIVALLHVPFARAQPVTRIVAGAYHSLFLKSDGSLWAMGDNVFGALGDGTYNTTNRPEEIVVSNVTAIAAGYGPDYSLFLKSDGSLWAVGYQGLGALGDGMPPDANLGVTWTNIPEEIVASNVIAIAAGDLHSLFLKKDGSLWGMGANGYGQLGDGTHNSTNRPEMIVASNVTAIAAGNRFSLFLKQNGSLWAMGCNSAGGLGDGTYNNTNRPEMIVASNVMAIAAGAFYSLFLKKDGSLWGMGADDYCQLGDGTPYNTNCPEMIVASNVTAIAAGQQHSLFLKKDGSLWGMGDNSDGQLGDGTYNVAFRPERIIASGVTAISAGISHSLFIKSNGSLWGMGGNTGGQLGDGTYNNTNLPEQIVAGPPGYNRISVEVLSGGSVGLSYMGLAGTNYELDWSASLAPANWVAEATNSASYNGMVVFTNTPDTKTNNFWRIHFVP